MDAARNYLFPVYASLLTPMWLRLLGARVGRGTEISTALAHAEVRGHRGRRVPGRRHHGRVVRTRRRVDLRRQDHGRQARVPGQLGHHPTRPPGPRRRTGRGVVGHTRKAKRGSSWLGSPPMRLRRRPPRRPMRRLPTIRRCRLKVMRAVVETFRLLPMIVTVAIGLAVLGALQALTRIYGIWWAALCGGLVLLAAGAIAGGITVAAKWLVVGRIRAGEFPLWSSFVWRNEVADTFVETVAAPWFARAASGTPVMNMWLRALGAASAVARGAKPIGCPRRIWSRSAAGSHGQPGLCGADPPVPRPDHADGHRGAGGRRDPRAALRRAARRPAGRGSDRRARVAGDARRRSAAIDSMAGQSDQPVGARPQKGGRQEVVGARVPRTPPRETPKGRLESRRPGHRSVPARKRRPRLSGVALRAGSGIQGLD